MPDSNVAMAVQKGRRLWWCKLKWEMVVVHAMGDGGASDKQVEKVEATTMEEVEETITERKGRGTTLVRVEWERMSRRGGRSAC